MVMVLFLSFLKRLLIKAFGNKYIFISYFNGFIFFTS